MGKENKGQPGGTNKSEGTGLVPELKDQDLKKTNELTNKYIDGVDELADNVREIDPNRNTDKEDPTNAGGYHY